MERSSTSTRFLGKTLVDCGSDCERRCSLSKCSPHPCLWPSWWSGFRTYLVMMHSFMVRILCHRTTIGTVGIWSDKCTTDWESFIEKLKFKPTHKLVLQCWSDYNTVLFLPLLRRKTEDYTVEFSAHIQHWLRPLRNHTGNYLPWNVFEIWIAYSLVTNPPTAGLVAVFSFLISLIIQVTGVGHV